MTCPTCGHRGRLPDNVTGGRIKCPKCGFISLVEQPAPPIDKPKEEEVLEVLPALPTETAEEVLEVLPVEAAAKADRLASCRLLRGRSFRIRADSTSPSSLDYNIFGPDSDEALGFVQDQSEGSGGLLEAFSQKGSYASRAVIYDAATDKSIMVVHREAFRKVIGVNPSRVEICDHRDRVLGWFEVKPLPAKGVFTIYDHRDRPFAEVEGKWFSEPDYVYVKPDGTKIGRLSAEGEVRRFFTAALSWCKRGGVLSLVVAHDLADNPQAKALLLATTITLEQFGGSIQIRSHMR
jgi:hypothetical protein